MLPINSWACINVEQTKHSSILPNKSSSWKCSLHPCDSYAKEHKWPKTMNVLQRPLALRFVPKFSDQANPVGEDKKLNVASRIMQRYICVNFNFLNC